MSKLAVRTKGDSSPQGKPRVYFSCHPGDFEKCFDILCGDVFETQDCAIYYESDRGKETDTDELTAQLSDMQLFIVPLTEKFLFEPSRARDAEYGFAIRHRIPILPIAVESGIDAFFAEQMNRIGEGYSDLQFLDRASKDKTGIPYGEKLGKRLSGILVGDELAERVRAAFDAYIFLSYRKKDRGYAKELMRLIHRIPYCRDVAIWYDEFLVPGEGWSKAIQEAMEKSKLVALAVTPSVLEEGNFVMEREYPDAVKAGKQVVPAEMLPTDRDALARLFKGIAEPVDGTDAKALEEALKSIAIQENGHVPEHNFLIGLAYLGAIDVERDPERAAELITSAAEAEEPVIEAIEKLVSMYNAGEAVQRDYLKASQWQEKLVDALEKAKEDPLADRDIVSALWDAGDMWEALGKLGNARKSFEKMLDYAVKRDGAFHSPETKRDISISYEMLGDICGSEGDLQGARDYYAKSLALFEALTKETGTVESRRDLSVNYERLGNICRSEGDLQGAQDYLEKSLKLIKTIAEETGTVESYRSLSTSYSNLGLIFQDKREFKAAKDNFGKSLKIRESLAKEMNTVESQRDLLLIYNEFGRLCLDEENPKAAQKYYEKALSISEPLAKETRTLESRCDLSISYRNLALVCEHYGDLQGMRNFTEKFIALSKGIAEETESVESRRNLFEGYFDLGVICRLNGNLHSARMSYENSLSIAEDLAKENCTVKTRRDLILCYTNLGQLCREEGNLQSARECFEKSLTLSEALTKETGTVESRQLLSKSYNSMGDLNESEGDLQSAREYFEEYLKLSKALADEIGTVEAYCQLAHSYCKVSTFENDDIESLRKAYEIYCKLADTHPDVTPYSENRDAIGEEIDKRKSKKFGITKN